MKRNLVRTFSLLGVAVGCFAATAQGAVTGGGVTGGSAGGEFRLVPPPAAIGPDSIDAPGLLAFNERQDLTLRRPLPVGPDLVLGVGSIVSSHYVAFDPATPGSLTGFIDFDEPIIGVLAGSPALERTTPLLGVPGTAYTFAPAIGPDPGTDVFRVAPGMPNRLLLELGAGSPGDHLRVLTGVAVPEPGAATVIGSTLVAALSSPRRRRAGRPGSCGAT